MRDQPGAVKDLFDRGKKLADACSADNPATSLAFLEAIEPAAPKGENLLPARQKLLERLVRDQPENIDNVSRLAVVFEQTGHRDRCKPLLEPLEKKLGTSEGARILGLLYFEQGKHEQAYALLQPYVDSRINALRDAEKKYETASKEAQEQIFQRLKDGTAKDFDVTRYRAAPEKQKGEMLGEYMTRHLKNNKELTNLQESFQSQLAVVPVVLDLGMLQLARGQRLTDIEERKAELERAEKTFLSVRGIAGEQAEYKLSLGQVYYWLGKQEEGRILFEEVLKADGRKFESLAHVAHLLRELGAMADARTLLEEAYAKTGVEQEKRQQAALMRALSRKDLDDEISWLEKANPNSAEVKAALANARGQKALREGQDNEAAKAFREAVAVYQKQPENAATLNNAGLANLSVYQASGERAALDAGIAMLEKGLSLDPGNGITTGNLAATVLSAGLADVIGNRIDLAKLKQMAGVSDLAFLFLNHAGQKVLARQLSDNARIKRARTLFDRALVLAPNNAYLYSQCEQLLSFLDDREGLANLERRAREATPDLAAVRQQMQDFWQGKNDALTRQSTQTAVARGERMIAAARPGGGPTFALAVSSLIHARHKLEQLGSAVDNDALVKLAEEAHKAAPSSGTVSLLMSALLARANKSLAEQEPEYAAMERKARRSLGSVYLVAVALWREGKPRLTAMGNADVVRVMGLILEDFKQLPDQTDEWNWVMVRTAHPDDAARIAEALKKNERMNLERLLEVRLSPVNAITALRQCWALEAKGKLLETTATPEPLKQAARAGVPLPFEVP